MIQTAVRSGAEFLVLGPVRGLASEVAPLTDGLTAFAPTAVGLGISFEEVTGLRDHFVGAAVEPLVPLTPHEVAEARGLARYGEVRVPNPAALAAIDWATAHEVPVEGLDPSDEQYADLFTDHISYFELVRRTVRERRLTRDPPRVGSAEEYATRWQSTLGGGRGSRAFEAARSSVLVASARRLGERLPRVAVVVDRERFDGIVQGLSEPRA